LPVENDVSNASSKLLSVISPPRKNRKTGKKASAKEKETKK